MHLVGGEPIDEVDTVVAAEVLPRRLPHHRGQVNRVDQLHLREGVRHPAQSRHDVGHGLAVVLPPVAGHEDDLSAGVVQMVEEIRCEVIILHNRGLEGVDHGIARDKHPVGDPLPLQVCAVGPCGAEVQVGDVAHQLAVHLLRKGRILVTRAESRLHMAHPDLVVKGGQRPGEGCGGVPVDQHQVGSGLLQHPLHAQQALGGDGGEGLAGLHDVQMVIDEPESSGAGIEHLPVLGRHTADRLPGPDGAGAPPPRGTILMASGRVPKMVMTRTCLISLPLLVRLLTVVFLSVGARRIRAMAPAKHRASSGAAWPSPARWW